ncbi:MAG: YcaO-like family protein, partial [Albidovulum sp.]
MALIAGETATATWPNFPAAATLAKGRLGHGAGPDRESAMRRAAGELIEIASCCCWGDEELVWAPAGGLGDAGWTPAALLGFSDEQRRNRESWNARLADLDWIPAAVDSLHEMAWLRATCAFSGRTILVPADFALIGRRERGDEGATAVADTSGCA